jgi:hypothetical protein
MCIQSLGVIIFSLLKKDKDREGEERDQPGTFALPMKKSTSEGGLAMLPEARVGEDRNSMEGEPTNGGLEARHYPTGHR